MSEIRLKLLVEIYLEILIMQKKWLNKISDRVRRERRSHDDISKSNSFRNPKTS